MATGLRAGEEAFLPERDRLLVGIDGRPANAPRRAGVGTYCSELLRALAARADVRLRVYLDHAPHERFPLEPSEAELRVLPSTRAWTFRRLGPELRRDPPAVFLSPGLQAPAFCPCPRVATVHDLAYLTFPAYFTFRRRLSARFQLRMALWCAQHFVADSEATRQDLRRLMHVPLERISVGLAGCAARFQPCGDPELLRQVRATYELPEHYILYVGRLQPRKNLDRLIKAFELLRERRPDLPHELVLAGDKGWLYADIFQTAQESPARDAIHFTGFVEDADLPVLTSGASVLALVSLWEGFGLPVVEAMACETAVVTSNSSSLAEVAGDAALTVDPYNVEAISQALERVVSDETLRRDLQARGRERARAFTWEKTAERVVAALHQTLGKR